MPQVKQLFPVSLIIETQLMSYTKIVDIQRITSPLTWRLVPSPLTVIGECLIGAKIILISASVDVWNHVAHVSQDELGLRGALVLAWSVSGRS